MVEQLQIGQFIEVVKLNNPLMGTETLHSLHLWLYHNHTNKLN